MKGGARPRPSSPINRNWAVHMVTTPVVGNIVVNIDEQRFLLALEQAGKQIDGGANEITVDFSSVRRIDTSHVRRMVELAHREKGAKIVLRGVNVDVYKTLKLLKLTNHFSFAS